MTENESDCGISGRRRARILAITSGKRGAGKTSLTANLGVALAQKGSQVCILDADTGPGDFGSPVKTRPERTLEHLINGEITLQELLLKGPANVRIVPAAAGIGEFATLDIDRQQRLLSALRELESSFDYLLIDTACGTIASLLNLLTPVEAVLLILTPDPTSLTEAFSLLKLLDDNAPNPPVYAVVNMVKNQEQSREIFSRFLETVQKYLDITVDYGGYVPLDEAVLESTRSRTPIVITEPESPASRVFFQLAVSLKERLGYGTDTRSSFSSYTEQLTIRPADQHTVPPFSDDRSSRGHPEVSREPEQLLSELIALINSRPSDPTSWKSWFQTALEAYVDRHNGLPFEPKQILYRSLELENYSETAIQEIVTTLESLYQMRYQRPLHNFDDTAFKLLADAQGSPDKIVQLSKQIRMGFKRRFHKDLYDAKQELVDEIQGSEYTEQLFEDLLASLLEAFEKRFRRAYLSENDLILVRVRELTAELIMRQGQIATSLHHVEELTNHSASKLDALVRLLV